MRCKLLVVVYDQDLPQFDLMIYCLNKNWQGHKQIVVVYQGNIKNQVNDILKEYLTIDWVIDLVPSHSFKNLNAYDTQQIDKILYSIDHTVDYVIVFDCKDFLLKPINENYFIVDSKARITTTKETFAEFYPEVADLNLTTSDTTAILNITPWIWNVEQLEKYWSFVTSKYSLELSSWTKFYPISEIASYYYFTTTIDFNPLIQYDDQLFMPTGGIWDNDTWENVLLVVENFDKHPTAVWKHHRRITDFSKTIVTVMQLQKYSIPIEIISKWIKNKHNML